MVNKKTWYEVENVGDYDSPALLVYPERIKGNIRRVVEKVEPGHLRPHVKTNKIAEVCSLMQDAGIQKFKAATIAEAEMLAMIKAKDVLLAYPPTIPKAKRLIRLIQKYPETKFSCLVDHEEHIRSLSSFFTENGLVAHVYIDLNLGMNRTGVRPEKVPAIYQAIKSAPSVELMGLHSYDGHIRDRDVNLRKKNVEEAFTPVLALKKDLEKKEERPLTLVAGGTPTGFIHAELGHRESSPGTFIFWDRGYSEILPEQDFEWAAVVISRVISIPGPELICTDLGHKSVAAENPPPRIYFLNAPEAVQVSQSEEHLVLKVPDSSIFKPGDVLYGVPWHICPTVALYDKAWVVEHNQILRFWEVVARKREITI